MNVYWLTGALAALLALAQGCRVSDERVLTVRVPALSGEADAARIRKALAPLSGVRQERVVVDLAARTVVVTYDSMMVAHKNIEIAIAEAGYAANGIQAVAQPDAK